MKHHGPIQQKDYETLQSLQLNYLANITKMPKSASIAARYLELGILTVKYEIEIGQILFPKRF